MNRVDPKDGKLLYHLTRIENVPSIISRGLLPRSMLNTDEFIDIADHDILGKREKRNLSDYVLFHFYVKNPFDWAVCRRSCLNGEKMAIISIYRSYAADHGALIIPSHPAGSDQPGIYSYQEGYDKISWNTMKTDYTADPIEKKYRMAEVIIPSQIPSEKFAFIYVSDVQSKEWIEQRIGFHLSNLVVQPNMFPRFR